MFVEQIKLNEFPLRTAFETLNKQRTANDAQNRVMFIALVL